MIIRDFPVIYKHTGEKVVELQEAFEINEQTAMSRIPELNFKYPYYQTDGLGNPIKDSVTGAFMKSEKLNYILNEQLIEFKGRWYILKLMTDGRTTNGKFAEFMAQGIEYELTEKYIQFLDMTYPTRNPVSMTEAMKELFIYGMALRQGQVTSSVSNTVVLDSGADTIDDIYNYCSIKIVYGNGVGQTRTITDYVGSTKTATLDSAFSPLPDATSVFVVYNSTWSVGTVSTSFTGLREHKFDFDTIWSAIDDIRQKYLDTNSMPPVISVTASFSNGRLLKQVNLSDNAALNSPIMTISYRRNMKEVKRLIDTSGIYTRIIPEGGDNLGVGSLPTSNRTDNAVTYPEHIFGRNYIDNFKFYLASGYSYKQCLDLFIKEYYFDDQRYHSATSLYDDSKKLLATLSMPKITYTVKLLDLSVLGDYPSDEISVGQVVRVYDYELNIDLTAHIVDIQRNEREPQNPSVSLSNFVDDKSTYLANIIQSLNKGADLKSIYGNTVTYIVADKKSSLNWRKADIVVGEFEYANDVIQKLVDSIDSAKGAKIVLMEGIYYFNNSISLKSNVYLEGQGTGTKLVGIGTRSIPFAVTTNGTAPSRLSNIGVSKMNINNFTNGVGYSYCDNVKLNDLLIQNIENNYIIAQSSSNVYIYDNIIATPVYATGVGQDGIDIKSCNIVNVSRNTIYTCLYRGINIQETIGDVNIIDNVVESNYTDFVGSFTAPIYIYNTNTPPLNWQDAVVNYRINVQGNTVLDTTTNNTDSKIAAIMVQAYRNVKIINNTLIGGVNCVYLLQSLDADVASNTLRYYKLQGIYVVGTTSYYCGRHKIQLNDLQSLTASNGIYIGVDVQDCVTTNNYLKNSCANPALKYADFGLNNTQTAGNRY